LKVNPRCASAFRLLALLAQEAGEYQKSIQWMAESLALKPEDGDAGTLGSLGKAYLDEGQISPAHRCYQRLAELVPQSPQVHLRLGTTLEGLGDWDAAAESYQLVLKLDPGLVDAHLHLGITHFLVGDLEKAVECFARVQELAPDNNEARTFLGHIHLLQ